MFIAGSNVPIRDASPRRALPAGRLRAAGVGVVATVAAIGLSRAFGTGHAPLYAVLMASSSAALILPIVDSLCLGGRPVVALLPQIAVADAACIVALPLVVNPAKPGHADLGALAVIAVSGILLGLALGAGAAGAHVVMVVTRQPMSLGLLAGGQLGVPVAAATIGTQRHVRAPGEASALMLGAIVAITLAVVGGSDLDELARGSYAVDLVRLAVSAVLAPHVALSGHDVVDILLSEWSAAEGGAAFDLDDDSAHHLRALVPDRPRRQYFERLAALPVVDPDDEGIPVEVREAVAATTSNGWHPTWHRRTAGTGSLGHPRFGAYGLDDTAAPEAREIKLLGPATRLWVEDVTGGAAHPVPTPDPALLDLVTDAVDGPHPYECRDGWQARRLSPDDVRIEPTGLAAKDSTRLLRSMARATAKVHAVDAGGFAASQHDANTLGNGWFIDAVQEMTDVTKESHAALVEEFGAGR